jgi:hypothetical protein
MESDALIKRVRNEFVEVPGLRLTLPQAMRLWGLDRDECQRVIDHLVESSFLSRNAHGQFVRAD